MTAMPGVCGAGGRCGIGCHRDHRGSDACRRRSAALGSFLAHAGGIDVAFTVERERGDLFLGSAVEHEAFAGRRNPVDQAAAISAGDQVSLGIEREHADVGFVALEEDRVLALSA